MDEYLSHRALINDWYRTYGHSIFKYILYMISDYQQAEDLLQEVFIRTFNYLESGKSIDYPKTFLYRTAHNITVDFIRKNAPIKLVKDIVFKKREYKQPTVEEQLIISEQFKELYQTVMTLKYQYRQVIILRKMEQLSVKETATVLKWSEGKVRTTLSRAMKALEKKLNGGE
ncbi:RNA polymerase sigma factor [Amphibacillus sp. Q70]|uniref:RNA polymerase sigma factor n=1 Tax=Amphibacillus sp. Q70 TaxID=3453416 RepID=UPI003F86BF0B